MYWQQFRAMHAATLVLLFAPVALAVDVPQWSTVDINLTASGSSSNWYTDPHGAVTATFTGPGGITKTVAAFWDGGNSFKIRFTPTVAGVWSYTTSSSNSGLNAKTGSINATAPLAGNHGFLRIDQNHTNSFVWDDGTRYFMWGQCYWDMLVSAAVNDNWQTAVEKIRDHSFTKIRLGVYPQAVYSSQQENHGYPDFQPYLGDAAHPDRDRLNLPLWKKLDQIVAKLESLGLVANLILLSPYRGNRMFGTAEQNDRFVRYVVARYSAYHNVIWCLSNEWNYAATYGGAYPQNQADFNRMGALVRNGDPWMAGSAGLRPLSTHQQTRIDYQFFGATWPTHAIIQYGPRNPGPSPAGTPKSDYGDQWGNAGIVYNLGHDTPVVNDEYAYLNEVNGGVAVSRTTCRLASWGIATAGGYGTTGDWGVRANWTPSVTGEWSDEPMYDDVKHLVDFFTTKGIEYWKMASHNELKAAGTRTYVLAEPGRQYVVYSATGGKFAIHLAAGTYYAYRYDPRTGETTALVNVSGGGTRSFTMPDSNDWVIHLSTFQETSGSASAAMPARTLRSPRFSGVSRP